VPRISRVFTLLSWRVAIVVVVAVLVLAAWPAATTAALIGCIVLAFIGPARALQALMIATLIVYANPAIIKISSISPVLLRLVLIAAVLRLVPTIRARDLVLIWPVWFFAALEALTSTTTSPVLAISIMKVVTFALAATAVLVAFNHLRAREIERMQSWMLTVGFTVIGLSALTLLKPGLGIGGNGGLQGILNQPQALGIFMAPFAAWSLAGVLLMRQRVSRIELWVGIGAVALIILTRARTGGFATMFGVTVVLLSRIFSQRKARQAPLGRPLIIVSLVGACILVLAVTTGEVSKIATAYAYKGTEKENRNLGAAFYDSRGGGVVSQWHNFLNQPLLGNGFGVYPDGKFPSGVVEVAGIPISAPIEKGFLPTAILEEGGILGAAALTVLILLLSRRAWRNTDLRWRAMFIACLGMNIGECVFLSPGGIGLFDWLLLGLALNGFRTAGPATVRPAVPDSVPLTPEVGAMPVSISHI
jgi:hypothetical protein